MLENHFGHKTNQHSQLFQSNCLQDVNFLDDKSFSDAWILSKIINFLSANKTQSYSFILDDAFLFDEPADLLDIGITRCIGKNLFSFFSAISSVECNYCFSSESRSNFSNWSLLKIFSSCSLKMEIHLNPIYILLNFKIIALYLRKLISYSPSDPESQSF